MMLKLSDRYQKVARPMYSLSVLLKAIVLLWPVMSTLAYLVVSQRQRSADGEGPKPERPVFWNISSRGWPILRAGGAASGEVDLPI